MIIDEISEPFHPDEPRGTSTYRVIALTTADTAADMVREMFLDNDENGNRVIVRTTVTAGARWMDVEVEWELEVDATEVTPPATPRNANS